MARKLQVEALEDRCLLSYAITDLGTLPGYETSYARDINAAGQVVGYGRDLETGTYHAFLWDAGHGMIDLGTLPRSTTSDALGINDSGQVVGYSSGQGLLWQDGAMTGLGTGVAHDINAAGQVVGGSGRAFLWENGVVTDLGTLPGYPDSSAANGINDSGQVVGYATRTEVTEECYLDWEVGWVCYPVYTTYEHAFRWQAGVMTDLGALGGSVSAANAINASGQAVGYVGVAGDRECEDSVGGCGPGPTLYTASLWQNGTLTLLPKPNGDTFANDINDRGQIIVGAYYDSYASIWGNRAAVLWRGGAMIDLNNEIPAGSGWVLKSATAINEDGQIVGYGTINGQTHAFVLTPTTPPLPTLTIKKDVSYDEGRSGITYFDFTVSLSAASAQTVTVNFATGDGSAKVSDNDYVATSGTLTFAPGETTKTITVKVKGDKKKEADETFFVNLSGVVNALIADGQGLGTILNDD